MGDSKSKGHRYVNQSLLIEKVARRPESTEMVRSRKFTGVSDIDQISLSDGERLETN